MFQNERNSSKQNKEDSLLQTVAKTVVGAINELKTSITNLTSSKLDKSGGTLTGGLTTSVVTSDSRIPGTNKQLINVTPTGNGIVHVGNSSVDRITLETLGNGVYANTNRIYHEGFKPTAADVGLNNVENLNKNQIISGLLPQKAIINGAGSLNATVNSPEAWNFHGSTCKIIAGNNALATWVDEGFNSRKSYIQCGHSSEAYANSLGVLGLNPFGGNVTINGQLSWHNGNNPISKAQNGYCKLANGLIIQWGNHVNGNGTRLISLPISFSNLTYTIATSLHYSDNTGISTAWTDHSIITGQKTVSNFYAGTGVTTRILGMSWIAIGY